MNCTWPRLGDNPLTSPMFTMKSLVDPATRKFNPSISTVGVKSGGPLTTVIVTVFCGRMTPEQPYRSVTEISLYTYTPSTALDCATDVDGFELTVGTVYILALIHISEPTRRTPISYAVFCLKKKKEQK